jgi:hypothetical protein
MQRIAAKLPPPVQVALKYGFFMALLLGAVFVSLFYVGRHPLLIPVIYDVRILLLAVFIFFSVKEFRDYQNGGVLHFWQGILVGLVLTVTVGLLMLIIILTFGAVEENLLSGYLTEMTAQLADNKEEFLQAIGEEAYQNTLRKLPSTTLGDLALDYYLKSFGIGLFLSIIISVILRRQIKY